MSIDTSLILCAGYGKRLKPITLEIPKPLIKLKNSSLLENCINLNINLGIKKIIINTHHLKDQFYDSVKKFQHSIDIEIIEDGKQILDTGGGILNMINNSKEQNFLVFNPDTLWGDRYIEEITSMIDSYLYQKSQMMLMLVNKKLSFDKKLTGDFDFKKNLINHNLSRNYIYTGCQIINRDVFKSESSNIFSISKIWDKFIQLKKLNGFESKLKFYHLTDYEIFKKLKDL